MSTTRVAALLLLFHLLFCLVLWLLMRLRILKLQGYFLPFMVFVPVWGPLCVLLLSTKRLFGSGFTLPDLDKLRINEELHRSILVENREDTAETVPLEEALLVNSSGQRRKLVLSILTDDPAQYYDLLQQARMNEDSEVVHYAATAMAQVSKQADLELQQHEHRYAAAPDDPDVLASYTAYLKRYLASGLVQGRAAEIQRRQLAQLLQKQLQKGLDYSCGCTLAQVQLDLREYEAAEQTLSRLIARWPQRETPWLLRLRSAAARRDGAELHALLDSIRQDQVYLSSEGQEAVRFWQASSPKGGPSHETVS